MAKLNGKNGNWYTDKQGNHYFVGEGETPKEGWEKSKRMKMIKNGKPNISEDGENFKEVDYDEYNKFEGNDDEFDINEESDFENMTAEQQQEWDIKTITEDVHSKYSRTPKEEIEKIVREEWKPGRDYDEIQEAVEDRMVNDPNVTGSNTNESQENKLTPEQEERFNKKSKLIEKYKEMGYDNDDAQLQAEKELSKEENQPAEEPERKGLVRETLVDKFDDAHLYNDGGKFQLALSNGKMEEFDTKNEAIDYLSKYSNKDYSWAKDEKDNNEQVVNSLMKQHEHRSEGAKKNWKDAYEFSLNHPNFNELLNKKKELEQIVKKVSNRNFEASQEDFDKYHKLMEETHELGKKIEDDYQKKIGMWSLFSVFGMVDQLLEDEIK